MILAWTQSVDQSDKLSRLQITKASRYFRFKFFQAQIIHAMEQSKVRSQDIRNDNNQRWLGNRQDQYERFRPKEK